MGHQVLEEYNILHKWHKQGDTKLLKLLNEYLLMVTFSTAKTIQLNSKRKILFAQH